MKKSGLLCLSVFFLTFAQSGCFAKIPLVEFTSKPNTLQFIQPQNTSLLFYTIRNNTTITLPLTYTLSNTAANLGAPGNTCGSTLMGKSSCVLAIQYQAPSENKTEYLTVSVDYQSRAPLSDTLTIKVDSAIACALIPTASYQSPFCQQQYQKVLQYSPNVFNISNTNVLEEQTLGGVFGIYQKLNNEEQICYINCGLRDLNGTAPNQYTIFELASVTKTLTTSIFGKYLVEDAVHSPTDGINTYAKPAGLALSPNETPVTFQQLATFSGGVCFSDAPSVVQSNTDQAQNQANFISDINTLNPDPSTTCPNGKANIKSEYPGHLLPSHNLYSNSSVGLLGQSLMSIKGFTVIEEGFNKWMCQNLIDVLDMERSNGCLPDQAHDQSCASAASTCTYGSVWTNSEYASGYHITIDKTYQKGDPFPFLPWAPAGGIRSNAFDMIKFIRANLGFSLSTNPTTEETNLIAGMQLAHQPNDYRPAPGIPTLNKGSQNPLNGPQGYAWVCQLSPTNGDNLCGKIGGHTNFRSFVGLNKSQNYGVVILFNTGAVKTDGSFTRAITPPSVGQIGTDLMENIN